MDQNEIDQLIHKGSLPDNPAKPDLIETHANWVLLSDKYVYKIKKNVKFSFLDYSTFPKRLHFCNEEIRLNKRTSDIYLDVLPIIYNHQSKKMAISPGKTGTKHKQKSGKQLPYSLHGKWDIIDHCVCMKKIDNRLLLSNKLLNNQVTEHEIKNLALEISEFHKSAEKSDIPYSEKENLLEFNDIIEVLKKINLPKNNAIEIIIVESSKTVSQYLKQNQNLLKSRIKAGMIRDCHGDLHCENIFMDIKPIIFDCIEFNKTFREIDILSEVAFICMDLEAFGRHDLSNVLLKNYLGILDLNFAEKEKKLFIYYKLCKANVRAKVLMLKGETSLKLCRYIILMKKYSDLLKN